MMMLEIAIVATAIGVLVLFTAHILPHPANLQDCVIETAEICT